MGSSVLIGILVRKLGIKKPAAKKLIKRARKSLDIDESVVWSKELEQESVLLHEMDKNRAKAEAKPFVVELSASASGASYQQQQQTSKKHASVSQQPAVPRKKKSKKSVEVHKPNNPAASRAASSSSSPSIPPKEIEVVERTVSSSLRSSSASDYYCCGTIDENSEHLDTLVPRILTEKDDDDDDNNSCGDSVTSVTSFLSSSFSSIGSFGEDDGLLVVRQLPQDEPDHEVVEEPRIILPQQQQQKQTEQDSPAAEVKEAPVVSDDDALVSGAMDRIIADEHGSEESVLAAATEDSAPVAAAALVEEEDEVAAIAVDKVESTIEKSTAPTTREVDAPLTPHCALQAFLLDLTPLDRLVVSNDNAIIPFDRREIFGIPPAMFYWDSEEEEEDDEEDDVDVEDDQEDDCDLRVHDNFGSSSRLLELESSENALSSPRRPTRTCSIELQDNRQILADALVASMIVGDGDANAKNNCSGGGLNLGCESAPRIPQRSMSIDIQNDTKMMQLVEDNIVLADIIEEEEDEVPPLSETTTATSSQQDSDSSDESSDDANTPHFSKSAAKLVEIESGKEVALLHLHDSDHSMELEEEEEKEAPCNDGSLDLAAVSVAAEAAVPIEEISPCSNSTAASSAELVDRSKVVGDLQVVTVECEIGMDKEEQEEEEEVSICPSEWSESTATWLDDSVASFDEASVTETVCSSSTCDTESLGGGGGSDHSNPFQQQQHQRLCSSASNLGDFLEQGHSSLRSLQSCKPNLVDRSTRRMSSGGGMIKSTLMRADVERPGQKKYASGSYLRHEANNKKPQSQPKPAVVAGCPGQWLGGSYLRHETNSSNNKSQQQRRASEQPRSKVMSGPGEWHGGSYLSKHTNSPQPRKPRQRASSVRGLSNPGLMRPSDWMTGSIGASSEHGTKTTSTTQLRRQSSTSSCCSASEYFATTSPVSPKPTTSSFGGQGCYNYSYLKKSNNQAEAPVSPSKRVSYVGGRKVIL